jgi:hypothetical protein
MVMRGRVDPDNMDMNLFIFGPQKQTLIGRNRELIYDRQSFYIQTPVCQVLEFDHTKRCIKMQFSKEYNPGSYQLLCGLNSLFFKHLREHYPDAEFISSVTCGHVITIDAKIDPNVLYFDANKDIIISDDITEGDLVICLVKTKGLWIDDDNSSKPTGSMKWNVFQLLKLNNS